jgi:hypothetical protein
MCAWCCMLWLVVTLPRRQEIKRPSSTSVLLLSSSCWSPRYCWNLAAASGGFMEDLICRIEGHHRDSACCTARPLIAPLPAFRGLGATVQSLSGCRADFWRLLSPHGGAFFSQTFTSAFINPLPIFSVFTNHQCTTPPFSPLCTARQAPTHHLHLALSPSSNLSDSMVSSRSLLLLRSHRAA